MQDIPLIQKIDEFYVFFFDLLDHVPKKARFVLCLKIEQQIIDLLCLIAKTNFTEKSEKMLKLREASSNVDVLKLMIRTAYHAKAFDQKQYIQLESRLDEIGRMVGGWLKNSATSSRNG